MTQYNILHVKLSNLQLSKLKSGTKYGTEVTLKLSSNIVGDYNDENNFLQKFLLTIRQVSQLHKVFPIIFQLIKFLRLRIAKFLE